MQFEGNLGDRPIPIDHPMRGLRPILRGKRNADDQTYEHPSRDHRPPKRGRIHEYLTVPDRLRSAVQDYLRTPDFIVAPDAGRQRSITFCYVR